MKGYIKGMITGILIGAVIASVPAVAENIDILFNSVRININGIDRIQWDENITLSDGTEAASSILYNGTTYLPIRKINEITGNKVYWNGDSKTVSVTSEPRKKTVITEAEDMHGNMWEYYTFNTAEVKPSIFGEGIKYNYYLGVSDKARGYERVYRMLNTSVSLTYGYIYFVKAKDEISPSTTTPYYLVKLRLNNTENTQDGEEKAIGNSSNIRSTGFDGEWLFIGGVTPGNYGHAIIRAYNCMSGEQIDFIDDERWTNASNLKVRPEGNTSVITFDYGTTGPIFEGEVTFDKTTRTFGEMKRGEQKE